jgi:hypothetical protein
MFGVFEACERLSLHVTLGAVGLSTLTCEAWGVTPSTPELTALGAAVSLVYCLDHSFDAHNTAYSVDISHSASTQRAAQHHVWVSHLKGCVVLSALVGLWAAAHLPRAILSLGIALALSCALYLLWAHRAQGGARRSTLKKLTVAFGYPLGLSLPVLARAFEGRVMFSPLGAKVTLSLWALTSANLLLFELMERAERAERAEPALLSVAFLLSLTPLVATLSALSPSCEGRGVLLVMSFIGVSFAVMLTLAWRQPHILLTGSRYRVWADALFLVSWTPFILSILSGSL